MYAAAKQSRLTYGWGNITTSADSELATSLGILRTRSRALIRDASYAKRAKVIVVNNIIGAGIGMQAQVMTSRGQLNDRVNDEIESVWERWSTADNCHVGGSLNFADYERMLVGQLFEAGEIFTRKYYQAFGSSEIPLSLEIIEPERVADIFQPTPISPQDKVRLGIEVDRFYRPVAYWFRQLHPGDIRLTPAETDQIERVIASMVIHLRIIDRWPQTRGEPWLHAVARRLNDMDGYSEAEIIAARAAASYMGIIETPEADTMITDSTGSTDIELEPGLVQKLIPGEKFNFVNPNRPNANMDAFMRLMLREVAAGVGVSYESLSRDYSQSNYSSSRLALIDDRDLWKTLQLWFIRNFRQKIHADWLQQAVLSGAIKSVSIAEYAMNPEKFNAVRFKPRGWSWIDPTKEVEAYKEAVRCGFSTVTDVIALTSAGRDIEDVLNERRQELDMMKEKDLMFDTDPSKETGNEKAAVVTDTNKEAQDKEEQAIIGGNNGGKNT
jgi:lambda family phage portal protein